MKKSLFAASGLAFGWLLAVLGFGGCKSNHYSKEIESVYGPPPEYEKSEPTDTVVVEEPM